MPTECVITFPNNPEKVFYSGQTLVGHVDLSLTNPKSVRGIYVEISGAANCEWTEGEGGNKKVYSGHEIYLNARTYLVGRRPHYGEITLLPGQYSYDFSCHLPLDLPTSLEAEYGYIRYMATVVMDRTRWPDHEYEEIFTVIKQLNLIVDPDLRLPGIQEMFKTFNSCFIFCCCPSGPMHLIVRISEKGYTPGQTINMEIEVDNKSEIEAEFSVQLMKQITYHIYANSDKQRIETILICDKSQIGCSRIGSFNKYRPSLLIPPIPPTDVDGSNICKVEHILRIIGSVDGCHSDVTIDMPITIGSHPILDVPTTGTPVSDGVIVQQPTAESSVSSEFPEPSDQLLVQNGISSAPCGPTFFLATASAPPPYPEDDPPTYEQAIAVNGNTIDGKNFRPNYPVYRQTTSYSRASNE